MVYSFSINNRAFKAIKEGKKKFENRVTKVDNGFDYSVIKKDDYIKLTSFDGEKQLVRVLYVHWYQSAEELLMVEGTKYTLSSTDDYNEGVKSLLSFKGYPEGIRKNGIFCIRIEPVTEGSCRKVLLEDLECISTDIEVDKYISCCDKVKEDMEYPEWLGDLSEDDINYLLGNGSRIWMYYHLNNFVCSMMIIPTSSEDVEELGIDYNYLDVVDYGPLMVNCKYRGNGLAGQMLKFLDKYCLAVGYKAAICTTHPDNDNFINSLLSDGFTFINKKEFKRGERNIYLRKLDN